VKERLDRRRKSDEGQRNKKEEREREGEGREGGGEHAT